jgi:glucose-6-phosphate isomerase
VWGEPGTNGQHAFYQLLHQGTTVIPCEFLIAARGHEDDLTHQHELLISNCLAQSEALMLGRTLEEAAAQLSTAGLDDDEVARLAPHKVFPGDRPSLTLAYDELTPFRTRPVDCPLRAPCLCRGRDLGHQLLRPVGRGTGQGVGNGSCCRWSKAKLNL